MRLIQSLISISLLMLFDYAIAANTINGPRKALVIGNANYPKQGLFTKLPNPINDATGVAQRLREYGFAVTRVVNVGSNAMKQAINTFINNLDKSDVALVYYSGHGIVAACYEGEEQKNYLVPIQQVFAGRADVCEYGVSAQWVLNRLSERDGGMNMLLLDACRNVIAANKGFGDKGFVEMHGTGTFIGYASAPGQPAKGDDESNYSVFTGQLLEVLKAPNDKLPLELLFKRVRTAVANMAEEAGIQQVPWSDNGLVGEEDFCFSSPCVGLTDVVSEVTAEQLQRLEKENRQLREQMAVQKNEDEIVEPKQQRQQTQQLISDRYRDNGDGTVTDVTTNLMWKRCIEGQTWTGSTCTGEAIEITWDDAMPNAQQKSWDSFAGRSDWRVPTVKELKTLVYCSSGKPKIWNNIIDYSCEGEYQKPTIDQTAFPNTPDNWFWTATPHTNSCCSWFVLFSHGYAGGNDSYSHGFVRGVRAGQ